MVENENIDTDTGYDDEPVRRGRPKKPATVKHLKQKPQEEHYLGERALLPFSSGVEAELYLMLKRIEYHDKVTVTSILNEAVRAFVKTQPSAKKSLPEEEVVKLKRVKTAMDYHRKRVAKQEKEKNQQG